MTVQSNDVSERTSTPYFLVDLAEVHRQVEDFRSALPTALIYYALKANSEPNVLRAIAAASCGFEAASWPEIELLLGLGVEPDRIIYGTAVKPSSHVEQAVAAGVGHFAADSSSELDLLARLAPGAKVYVRTHVDDSRSVYQMSGKFGAPSDSVVAFLKRADDLGLVPWGISFNVGSQATELDAWARGIDVVAPLLEVLLGEHDLKLDVLNLGGGFPAAYRNHQPPRLGEIARELYAAIDRLPYQPQLIVEPGCALVASSTSLLTSVIARVDRGGETWLYLDAGVYNALFEALACQGNLRYPVSAVDDRPVSSDTGGRQRFVLAGPTGDGLDVIDRDVELPAGLRVGSRLRFDHAGAYTLTLASSFNGFAKPVSYEAEPLQMRAGRQ